MKVLFWMFIGFDRHATSEHLLSAVIEQLCKAGHSVHIIQKDTGGDLPPIPQKLSSYQVTTDVLPYKAVDKTNLIARYVVDLKYIRACEKYITSDYDAVFIQSNNQAGFAVRTVRKKLPFAIVTLNVQDVFPYNAVYSGTIKKTSIVFKALARIQRDGYRLSDHVITISEDMKDTLEADGMPSDKVEVIYNWSYQDELYENLDLAPVSYMFDKNYFNVVYAGNIGVMQNVDIIIEAAKLMKENESIWFHIIGDGVYKEKLEVRAKEYGIHNISFWAMQPPEIAPLIYSAADVNVIPLVKNVYRTALPSKTATCLACQKPIVFAIGTDSIFAKKVKETTGCEVIDSNDPESLCLFINKAKEQIIHINNESFFINYCSQQYNSEKYVAIITRKTDRFRG